MNFNSFLLERALKQPVLENEQTGLYCANK